MTEWVEQWICIKFCVKLKLSTETIPMIQKDTAVGSWWLAASSRQRTCSCITSHAEFFGETSNHPGDSSPLHPTFGALRLLAFPKTKSPLKGKRFQTIDEIQENTIGQLMATGRAVWGPMVPTLKGTKASLSYVQCIFFSKCLFFTLHGWIPSGQTSYITDILYITGINLWQVCCLYCIQSLAFYKLF